MNFKIALSTFLIFISFHTISSAQTASIKGKITNEAGLPIEFSNVTLLNATDSSTVLEMQASELGEYSFDEVKQGEYILASYTMGGNKTYSDTIHFDGKSTFIQNIIQNNKILQAEEVTVEGQRSLVKMEDGKMIVDVENTLGNSGLTAVEVLQKSPGVSIDQDGKIKLNGKAGVQVQIDGKVMYLSEDQLNNLLKSIPSDQLKKIEIITSPSAKYDATGNGGIINIVLKKGAYEGVNGTLNLTAGSGIYHKGNAGTNISYKKKKLSFNIGYQYNNRKGLNEFSMERINSDLTEPNHKFASSSYFTVPAQTHSIVLNGDYAISKKTDITFNFSDNYNTYTWKGDNHTELYNPDLSLSESSVTSEKGRSHYLGIYAGLGFKHKVDTVGTIFSGSGGYYTSRGFEHKDINIQFYDSLGKNNNNPFLFLLDNKNNSSTYNAQLDFEKKIFKKIKIETGVKTYQIRSYTPLDITITENFIPRDASNYFNYSEGVLASYVMGTASQGKWTLQGGLRLENTQVKGKQSIIDSTFSRNYTNLFPSGNLTYKLSQKTSFTSLYSRRITRPNGNDLNPLLTISNPYTSYGGDPYLVAQYADNTELTSSFFSGSLLMTLNYTYIKNPIVWASKLEKSTDKIISGPRNLDYQKNYGVSISVNTSIYKWWTSNNNFVFNNNQFVGTTDFGTINNKQNGWNVTTTQSFKLPKETAIEISGLYNSPSTYAFAYAYQRWQANLSVQKKIFHKRANIKIAFNDIFRTFQYAGITTIATTSAENFYRWDNRTFLVTFTYKFGNKLLIRD